MSEVVLGEKYNYVFGGPGPDITVLVPVEFTTEGIRCYDLFFKFYITVSASKLTVLRNVNDQIIELEKSAIAEGKINAKFER